MTKKLRLILIAVLAFIACTCLLAGCSLKPSLDEVLDDLNGRGAVVDVTYFANEGSFNSSAVAGNNSDKTYPNEEDDDHEHDYRDGPCQLCGHYPNEEDDGHEHNYKDGPCVYCGKYENKEDDGHEHKYKDDACVHCGKERSISNKHKVRTIRYGVGSTAINLGKVGFVSGSKIEVMSDDIALYELKGWYEAELDSNGNPVYDDGSSYVFDYDTQGFDVTKKIKYNEDKPFDFTTPLEKGTHYYLVAVWQKKQTVHIVLAGEVSSITIKESDTSEPVTIENGAEIKELPYQSDDGLCHNPTDVEDNYFIKASGVTFVEFYTAPTCKKEELFEGWPINKKEYEGDVTLYANYIEGEWTIVKDLSGVKAMFKDAKSSFKRFYLVKDIDCTVKVDNKETKLKVDPITADTGNLVGFGCKIRGNGCKISNFIVTTEPWGLSKPIRRASLFGDIKDSAEISDLIFENVTQEYTVNAGAALNDGIYFAFSSISDKAKVEGVEFIGTCTMTVTLVEDENSDPTYVNNLVGGADDHWKFGGNYSGGKDSDYNGGITITASAKLEIIHKN